MNEYEMPFDKKYKDVAKVLYSIRKLQEEQVIQLQEENKKLQQELDQYKNILEDIDKYIHSFKIENIGEKTMLILNDILLIKNGLGKDVVRLNKMKELEGE